MRHVTVHAAKTHLSRLIEAALAGEEVVISRGEKPVVRLVAIPQSTFKFGILANELTGPVPDFLEPLPDDELALWEGRS
jgi:antitoxin (DNA-binding transcriptional repressor) of toxin-antitoxin stability system